MLNALIGILVLRQAFQAEATCVHVFRVLSRRQAAVTGTKVKLWGQRVLR